MVARKTLNAPLGAGMPRVTGRLWGPILLVIAAVGCTCNEQLSFVEVSIAFPDATYSLGDTARMVAVARANGSADAICVLYVSRDRGFSEPVAPDSFTFGTSQPAIVQVTNDGRAIALQSGQAELWATTGGVDSRRFRVTVRDAGDLR